MLTRYLRVRLDGNDISAWLDGRKLERGIDDLVRVENGLVRVTFEAPAYRAEIVVQEPGTNIIEVTDPDGTQVTRPQRAGREFVVMAELTIPEVAVVWLSDLLAGGARPEQSPDVEVIEVAWKAEADDSEAPAQGPTESTVRDPSLKLANLEDDRNVSVSRLNGKGKTLAWLPVDKDGHPVSQKGEHEADHFMITGIHGLPQSIFGVPQLIEGSYGRHVWLAYDTGEVIRHDPDKPGAKHRAEPVARPRRSPVTRATNERQTFRYTITAIRQGQAAYKDPGVDNETDPGAP